MTTFTAEEVPVRSLMTKSVRPAFVLPVLIALGITLAAAPAGAQDPPKYHSYAELAKAVQALAGAGQTAVRVESIGRTRGGRDIWALEIANPGGIAPAVSRYYFDKYLEFGDEFVEWKPYDHPQFGPVEMGGVWKKYQGRVPPRFMNEELCHRNMAFSLYQADEMPLIRMGETSVEKVGGDVFRVFVDIANPKVAPTIMARAAQNSTVRPDLLLVDGRSAEVIAAGFIDNKAVYQANPSVTPLVDQKDLKRIIVRNGHPGKTTRTAMLLVKGSGTMTVTYDSVKGGKASTTVRLK